MNENKLERKICKKQYHGYFSYILGLFVVYVSVCCVLCAFCVCDGVRVEVCLRVGTCVHVGGGGECDYCNTLLKHSVIGLWSQPYFDF